MRIDIQYLNTEPDWDTKKYIAAKLNKLQLRYDWIMDIDVFIKNENNNHNKSKVVELKLDIPGETLFAEAHAESFHLAAKEALQGMEKQLKKYNTKKSSPHMERKSLHKISPAL